MLIFPSIVFEIEVNNGFDLQCHDCSNVTITGWNVSGIHIKCYGKNACNNMVFDVEYFDNFLL